jgi:DNA topoisomerase I
MYSVCPLDAALQPAVSRKFPNDLEASRYKRIMTDQLQQHADASVAASAAGLRYISDSTPGIERRRWGKGFTYLAPSGERIRDTKTLKRIKALVIPPAWEKVWIAPFEHAHIQAVGRDDKARKQYIYHPEWQCLRNEVKFDRMMSFSKALPKVRNHTNKHLRMRGLPKAKVLATIVRLLDSTHVRIGNVQYAKQNASFGLTTLRNRHVDISGSKIHFEFRGKSGVEQKLDVKDRRLAHIVRQCMEIPGYTLFQYYDEERKRQPIDSGDVNEYLREVCDDAFTAKDFRTWGGTLLAMLALLEIGEPATKTDAKKNVVQAVKQVAKQLGNQPSACRKYYIHPAILQSYTDGTLIDTTKKYVAQARRSQSMSRLKGLELEEWVMLNILERRA